MIHDLIGIDKNKVDLSGLPDVSEQMKHVLVAADQDDFFSRFMYKPFHEVCTWWEQHCMGMRE